MYNVNIKFYNANIKFIRFIRYFFFDTISLYYINNIITTLIAINM